MTSAAQGAGCVQEVSVLGGDRDCTPTRSTTTEPGVQPPLSRASAASCSCCHQPSCCFSDDWLTAIRLQSWEGTFEGTQIGRRGRPDRDLPLQKMKKKNNNKNWRHFGWMNRCFFKVHKGTVKCDYFVALFVWLWFVDVAFCWAGSPQWRWRVEDNY